MEQAGNNEGGAEGGAAAITATGEEGRASDTMGQQQQDKAYSSSSQPLPSSEAQEYHDDVTNMDLPQPSPHYVKQNAQRVKDCMNTKNI